MDKPPSRSLKRFSTRALAENYSWRELSGSNRPRGIPNLHLFAPAFLSFHLPQPFDSIKLLRAKGMVRSAAILLDVVTLHGRHGSNSLESDCRRIYGPTPPLRPGASLDAAGPRLLVNRPSGVPVAVTLTVNVQLVPGARAPPVRAMELLPGTAVIVPPQPGQSVGIGYDQPRRQRVRESESGHSDRRVRIVGREPQVHAAPHSDARRANVLKVTGGV